MRAGRKIGAGALAAIALALSFSGSARAYDVESDTAANTVFVLLRNHNPIAAFDSISIGENLPAFVSQATATIIPSSVSASGSDLAAVEFDVSAGAALGATGDLEITVSGATAGQPIDLVLTVPLEVVATAPAAQGVVGQGVPAPDPGGVDTDGDGVTDALEIAFGSNPASAASTPGHYAAVPALRALALAALVATFLISGVGLAHRRHGAVRR